jgi:hypothetical protein
MYYWRSEAGRRGPPGRTKYYRKPETYYIAGYQRRGNQNRFVEPATFNTTEKLATTGNIDEGQRMQAARARHWDTSLGYGGRIGRPRQRCASASVHTGRRSRRCHGSSHGRRRRLGATAVLTRPGALSFRLHPRHGIPHRLSPWSPIIVGFVIVVGGGSSGSRLLTRE